MNKGSTTNTILIFLLVVVVGFVVWHTTDRRNQDIDETDSAIEVNLGSDDNTEN